MLKYVVKLIPICSIVILTLALYGQFLWNPIIFDDINFFLVDNSGTQPVDTYKFRWFQLRSLPYATMVWTKDWFGLELIYFRVGNWLLHLAVALTLLAILVTFFEAVLPKASPEQLNNKTAAFFAALLFALHPVASYAAGYLVQRSILMATWFSLLAMLTYLQGSLREKPIWLAATAPLYFMAVYSKEHAVMLPATLIAMTILMHSDWRQKLLKRWLLFLVMAGTALAVILASRGLLGSVYEPAAHMLGNDNQLSYPLSILTQTWLFFKYAALWLFPSPALMSIDMREPFASTIFSVYILSVISYLVWGGTASWLLMKRGQRGMIGFAMLFPWLMFMTEFASVRSQEVFVLYRSYIWAVGAVCLLPVLFSKVTGKFSILVLSLISVAMFVITKERLMVMSEPLFVWDDAEKLIKGRDYLPGAYRIYYNRGTSYINMGAVDASIPDFKKTIALNPNFPDGHHNLGAAYSQKDDYLKAIAAYKQSIAVAAANGMVMKESLGNLAHAFLKTGQIEEAIAAYGRALAIVDIEKVSTGWPYFMGRAEAYEKLGNFQLAKSDYRQACIRAKKGCERLTGGEKPIQR